MVKKLARDKRYPALLHRKSCETVFHLLQALRQIVNFRLQRRVPVSQNLCGLGGRLFCENGIKSFMQ